MSFEAPKREKGATPKEAGHDEGKKEGGGGEGFQVPAGYFMHYLKSEGVTAGASKGDAKKADGKQDPAQENRTPLDQLRGKDPEVALAELSHMSDAEFDELMHAVDQRHDWQKLSEALGPRFEAVVGDKRYEPFAHALLAHPDGVCELAERTRLLQGLSRLPPLEATALRHAIQSHGAAQKLANLLGPELNLWLAGGAVAAPREAPKDDPRAALAAARKLEPATIRKLVESLEAGATGPTLAAVLGSAHDQYVRDYWEAVHADPQVKRTPKEALAALARVDLKPLRLLAHMPERGPEREELPPDAGRAQLEAILKPILKGSIPSAELVRSTLEAIARLPLAELKLLVEHVQPDELKALEASLGPAFARSVGDKVYQPLADALAECPPDRELPEAEKARRLRSLEGLDRWLSAKLAERVAEKGTGPQLAALFGAARLRRIGIEAAAAGPRPLTRPRVQPTKEQRKAVLDALKRMTPAQFLAVEKDCPKLVLFRYATACASGFDDELGRALLRFLPPMRDDEGEVFEPGAEDTLLRGFFERLSAEERSRDQDPQKQAQAGQAPERKRKREDEEGASMYDGLDVQTLYHQLAARHLKLDGQQQESTVDDRLKTVNEFQKLPPVVQRALVDHMHSQGTYERLVRLLGQDFARTTS